MAINLVGIHYNCRTIKFDPEQMVSLSLSFSLAVPGTVRFFSRIKKDRCSLLGSLTLWEDDERMTKGTNSRIFLKVIALSRERICSKIILILQLDSNRLDRRVRIGVKRILDFSML